MPADSLPLTEFHARPGLAIDRSQRAPVKLTKHNRAHAVVVSADWFDRAEKALAAVRGNHRVLDAHNLSEADLAFLDAHGPTAEEVASNEWRN